MIFWKQGDVQCQDLVDEEPDSYPEGRGGQQAVVVMCNEVVYHYKQQKSLARKGTDVLQVHVQSPEGWDEQQAVVVQYTLQQKSLA